MLPLGVRTLAGVVLQIDKSLEECARVCGAGWVYQMRTVTLPLLKPGILAAWLLIFMACVRELGASVFLMGPNAKVIAPSIVNAFATSGTELTAAMALIQTFTVIVALMILFRADPRHDQGAAVSPTRIEVKDLVVRYGDAVAVNGVSFTVGRGEHVTLLGPSGCGKTTTLRAIAGLEQPTAGSIRIDGQAMYDAAARRNVPTEQRGVVDGVPVLRRVAAHDGVRQRGLWPARAEAERGRASRPMSSARSTWCRCAISPSAAPRSCRAASSNAWRSRARSPSRRPSCCSTSRSRNLDAKLRAEMRVELRELQRRLDITSVYVTHDQEEALAISDRVIVMNVGVIEQIGTPEEIYNRPKSRFVADFVGSANLIKGRVTGPGTFEAEGGTILKTVGGPQGSGGTGSEVAVRTAYIDLGARAGDNQLPGTVRQRMFHGDFVQYIVECSCGRLIVRRPPVNLLEEGAPVTLSFSPEHTVLLQG